jgi:DNA-binding NtrC family response regulator
LGLEEVFQTPLDVDAVVLLARRALARKHLQRLTGIVGESDPIREALERVLQIARVDSTVLITGESGTGKELVARGIHALSPRRHKPFIPVNVAALSETLLESEIFGHAKGAFTGAIDSRRGFFELAHEGTIFLDEMGEMPLATQTKLLRVLEQREFLKVGGESPIRVDVRIITATNQNLRLRVNTGEFRRDLYHRLNVLHIELPPLRQRREDIPLLVEHFVKVVSETHDRAFIGISDEAMKILMEYDWPGNVRELRNLVESMVVLAPGREILASDIPVEVRNGGGAGALIRVGDEPMLPVPSGEGGVAAGRAELEFIFRTMVDMRMDVDQLRSEFELYRRGKGVDPPGSITGASDEPLLRNGGRGGRGGGRGVGLRRRDPRPSGWGRGLPPRNDHGGDGAGGHRSGPRGGGREPEEGGPNPRNRRADALQEDLQVRTGRTALALQQGLDALQQVFSPLTGF